MITYKFSDYERETAMKIAHLRNDIMEEHGCRVNVPLTEHQKSLGQNSFLDVHYMGVLAEWAVAITYGCSISVSPTFKHGDAGFDMVWKRKFVEVKHSNRTDKPDLFVRFGKERKADIFILVTGNDQQMDIRGWATSHDFFSEKYEVKDYGNYGKPVKAISIDKLRPIEDLDSE